MPLTRTTVTAASRIMLPAYVAHATAFGIIYLLDPWGRLQKQPSLVVLTRFGLPGLRLWGVVLIVCALLMTTALIVKRRELFVFCLYAYALINLTWAGIYTAAAFINPLAPFLGGGHVALVGVACVASARSLLKREVS